MRLDKITEWPKMVWKLTSEKGVITDSNPVDKDPKMERQFEIPGH